MIEKEEKASLSFCQSSLQKEERSLTNSHQNHKGSVKILADRINKHPMIPNRQAHWEEKSFLSLISFKMIK